MTLTLHRGRQQILVNAKGICSPSSLSPMAREVLCCCVPVAEEGPSLLLAHMVLTGEHGWWILAPLFPGAQRKSRDKNCQVVSRDVFMCVIHCAISASFLRAVCPRWLISLSRLFLLFLQEHSSFLLIALLCLPPLCPPWITLVLYGVFASLHGTKLKDHNSVCFLFSCDT